MTGKTEILEVTVPAFLTFRLREINDEHLMDNLASRIEKGLKPIETRDYNWQLARVKRV